jgi:hypothetical protein
MFPETKINFKAEKRGIMRQPDLSHIEAGTIGVVVEIVQLIDAGLRVIEVIVIEAIQNPGCAKDENACPPLKSPVKQYNLVTFHAGTTSPGK